MYAYNQRVRPLQRWSGLKTNLTAEQIARLPEADARVERKIVELAEETSGKYLMMFVPISLVLAAAVTYGSNPLYGMVMLVVGLSAMLYYNVAVYAPIAAFDEQLNGNKVRRQLQPTSTRL